MNNVGKLLKSNAVADEHDSSNDTSSDGESHKTSNLWTDAKMTINKDHLIIYCYPSNSFAVPLWSRIK